MTAGQRPVEDRAASQGSLAARACHNKPEPPQRILAPVPRKVEPKNDSSWEGATHSQLMRSLPRLSRKMISGWRPMVEEI